jgi:hypothetical protein
VRQDLSFHNSRFTASVVDCCILVDKHCFEKFTVILVLVRLFISKSWGIVACFTQVRLVFSARNARHFFWPLHTAVLPILIFLFFVSHDDTDGGWFIITTPYHAIKKP